MHAMLRCDPAREFARVVPCSIGSNRAAMEQGMTRCALRLALLLAGCAPGAALGAFQIQQLYSNADGAIQFVLLRETGGQNGQDRLAGKTLIATRATATKSYTFPADLPHASTANRAVLIATQGYLAAPSYATEFKTVAPDYVVPDRFLPTDGGTVSFAGVDQMTYAALPRDGFSALHRTGATIRDNAAQNYGGATASLPVIPVTAVEYYHAGLDHYFISALAADIDALDSGRIAGWSRTGQSFKVWPISQGFLDTVCRYYIPPQHGDSHFFSASKVECAAVASRVGTDPNFSGYVLETSDAFSVALPDSAGTCAAYWVPVYRLWNNRSDSNHRYAADPAIKAQMIARGYVAEGYGPDAVIMCSPID
jgi:hypothetical protein